MDDLNQSSRQGVWGRLEDALYEDVEVDGLRVYVIAGPVFRADDQVYRGGGLPREFWKILAYCRDGDLAVRAFLLTQDLDPLGALMALDEFRLYQVDLPARAGGTDRASVLHCVAGSRSTGGRLGHPG